MEQRVGAGLTTAKVSPPGPGGKPKLLEQVRELLRAKYYSIQTEEAYLGWIKRLILFSGKRHPKKMGETLDGRCERAGVARRNRSFGDKCVPKLELGNEREAETTEGAMNWLAVVRP